MTCDLLVLGYVMRKGKWKEAGLRQVIVGEKDTWINILWGNSRQSREFIYGQMEIQTGWDHNILPFYVYDYQVYFNCYKIIKALSTNKIKLLTNLF